MEHYSVLLVDDEEEVIDVMMHKIDWQGLGFEVKGSAKNGVKALELAEKYQPDVVITDIKMPYMDGLELSKHLRQDYPSIRIMIITGFDEFEYAKEAVHLEIGEYLLKPVNSAELTEALRRLKESLDQEREEKLNVQKLENYYEESLPLLQMNFFMSLIEGRIRESDLAKYLSDYRIRLTGPVYFCLVIHTSEHNVPENMSPLLLGMSVQQQAKERLGAHWNGHCFTYLGNTVMLGEMSDESRMPELTDECDRFCKWAERILGAKVTIGIGRPCTSLMELNSSYEGSREAVSYRVLYGSERAINIGEIAPQKEKYSPISDNIGMHDLLRAVHVGTEESIGQAVDQVIAEIHENARTVNQYDLAVKEMVGTWYRFCSENFLDFNALAGEVKNPYQEVAQMDEATLTAWLTKVAIAVHNNLSNARKSSSKGLIVKAQDIVKASYADAEMSLDTVCDTLGVSNSYFSSIFKKEVGKSFITYLTDYRMEQASRLLLETGEKNYEIAAHVGYVDANYFSYVFKKAFGMSPSQYRMEHTGSRNE